jgi:hypothetical protein
MALSEKLEKADLRKVVLRRQITSQRWGLCSNPDGRARRQGWEGNRGQLRAYTDALSGPGEHGTAIWTASYSGWLTFVCLCLKPNTAWAIPSMGLA